MRDINDTEVGGFGITSSEDLLLIEDIAIVKQKVSAVTVAFDDIAVADFFEDQVVAGRQPEQFARYWIHTHPGSSPEPSMTDEATFNRVFGNCDWSVMFILAQSGNSYARMQFTAGPGGQIKIPACVDYSAAFAGSDSKSWKAEYKKNVTEDRILPVKEDLKQEEAFGFGGEDLLEELEYMDPFERQAFMDELAVRSDFWDESEVIYE